MSEGVLTLTVGSHLRPVVQLAARRRQQTGVEMIGAPGVSQSQPMDQQYCRSFCSLVDGATRCADQGVCTAPASTAKQSSARHHELT
jgi:hypothetical protein